MADNSDCFIIGSTVACKTCYNQKIEGEVLAFDPQTKMLILKCQSSSDRPNLNDVHVVNLSLVSDVQVIHEVSSSSEAPQSLNLQRLNTRLRNQIENKKRLVTALQAGVSQEGQQLFIAISKTLPKQVVWNGDNIVVFNSVTIKPPYQVENVHGSSDCKAFNHVKKIVEKHMKDTATSSVDSPQQQQPTQQRELQPQIQKAYEIPEEVGTGG